MTLLVPSLNQKVIFYLELYGAVNYQVSTVFYQSTFTNNKWLSSFCYFLNYIHLIATNHHQATHHQTINSQKLNPQIFGPSESLTIAISMIIYFLLVIWAILSNCYVFILTNLKCLHVSAPQAFKIPSLMVIESRTTEPILWKPVVPWLGIWRRLCIHTYGQRKQPPL